MPYMNRKSLKEMAETFEVFRSMPQHLALLKTLKRHPDKSGYLYCYACGNHECSHTYDLGEYHPADEFFAICGKCFKEYYYCEPERIYEISFKFNFTSRFKIFERDGFKCVYCGRKPAKENDVELQIDHVYPKSKGGEDSSGNLVTACKECNAGKKDYILESRRR